MSIRAAALAVCLWLAASFAVGIAHPLWMCLAAEELAHGFAPVLGVEAALTVLAVLVAALIVLFSAAAASLFQLRRSGRAQRR
ncbi:hypothetical protein [Cupriavidus nantongensis]|uniref:Uncharacterized protein n=1 Tax=Cupriavidus nantongensis TaxID=1796606 RepID=A0A142JKF8_9BURK|nr:hypothetical protein [Cupriavidus nantongensis]AMR78570.1 hypothetical protein A2G96_12920 [Cupriavidus nantongensis]